MKTIYRIIDKETGKEMGSYDRSYGNKYNFSSVYEARNHNCHGLWKDEEKYAIHEYKLVLIDEDAK